MNYRKQEVVGILLCVIALFILLSFITYNPLESPSGLSSEVSHNNIMGLFGIYISYYIMKFSFGWGSFFIPIILLLIGIKIFTRKKIEGILQLCSLLIGLGIWVSLLTAWIGHYKGGFWVAEYPGMIGYLIFVFFKNVIGIYASGFLQIIFLILIISGFFKISIYDLTKNILIKIKQYFIRWKEYRLNKIENINESNKHSNLDFENIEKNKQKEENIRLDNVNKDDSPIKIKNEIDHNSFQTNNEKIEEINDNIKDGDIIDETIEEINNTVEADIAIDDEFQIEEGDLDSEKERQARYLQYKLPVLEYLLQPAEVKNTYTEIELKEKASQLIHALDTFGVSGRVVRISPGPVITLFEIEPAEGVRVNKFTNLSDDLARVMRAQRVRIIAPIPGSKSVGIELPNDNPAIVYLRNIINSEQFIKSNSKLSIGLGKTTTGDAYVFDLGQMPHILVAGATGAGKSVCINTMIVSIIYKAKPDEVKFILIDPKKLELATYKSLVGYHLITAPNLDEYVMTTAENAVGILDSAIIEMERRFQVFADARVRNISEYHNRREQDSSLENVPYIVVVIDELADLMLTSGRAIEEPITRLAQKARAVGIHLIVATQRPSVDVITGVIKSNFPARIAFQVSSKIDSRTIIDQMGAEKLLGKGDMLFLLPGTASPIRLHNAYVTLDEIESVMKHIISQPKPDEVMLPETRKESIDGEYILDQDVDELLKDAAILVIQNQQASVSLLQRKFRIGYSRAGRLIDELESLGIVSGYSGSKARDVLVDESYLNTIFND